MKMIVLLSIVAISAAAATKDLKSNSLYTDLTKDCVVISTATEKAPIDFYKAECKAFGGYQLNIAGGDLRYGPELFFNGQQIDLQRPGRFHDTGSDKIEWVYTLSRDEEGTGHLEWKGLIYRLLVANDTKSNDSVLYAVRLQGEKSCVVGVTKSNVEARELVLNSKLSCLKNENKK